MTSRMRRMPATEQDLLVAILNQVRDGAQTNEFDRSHTWRTRLRTPWECQAVRSRPRLERSGARRLDRPAHEHGGT
jgi:hypothetical protein